MKAWIAAAALLFAAPLAAQPQDVTAPGPVAHRDAGTSFPERVGALQRGQVILYGEGDLSANYDLERGADRLRLSVYIYPAPPVPRAQRAASCRMQMEVVAQSIAIQHGGATPIEQGAAPAAGGAEPDLGLRSVHRIRSAFLTQRNEELRSESILYCYVGGDWLVKYRATSTAGFETGAIIDEFIRLGPWPGRRPGEIALR